MTQAEAQTLVDPTTGAVSTSTAVAAITAHNQAEINAEAINKALAADFLAKYQDWLTMSAIQAATKKPVDPKPQPAPKIRGGYVDGVGEVWSVIPGEFVADYPPVKPLTVDVAAVGGPVGGPNPSGPGRYYPASSDSTNASNLGATFTAADGRIFVKQAEGFARFWKQVWPPVEV